MSLPVASDPLADLSAAGVSVWLDDLSRELLGSGELKRIIADRHVVGVTTNPTIFASALTKGDRYTGQLRRLGVDRTSVDDAVLALTTDDVRDGCDVLRPVHRRTGGADGRVSIEVDPRLARDADATIAHARRLWTAVDRPNLLVKVPATREGLTAITALVARGISVNVTLIFSLDRYRAVVDAYLDGLEQARDAGRDLTGIHSVASFFVSRVDTETDARLDALGTPEALALKGRTAIANARLAYRAHEELLASPRWQALAAAGARPQRPLWASTGVKDPAYPDTLYVAELALPGTVDTMPGTTLAAYADHGRLPEPDAARDTTAEATEHFAALKRAGVDFADVTDTLEREGLAKFEASWSELGDAVEQELRAGADEEADRLLAIYLNDHLTGAAGGLDLFHRAARAHEGRDDGAALADLARQVGRDRDALARIMTGLDITVHRAKVTLGRLAERLGRLKTNGRLVSRSPLSDVLELEAMLVGVRGKAACWRTLRALAGTDPRLSAETLDTLLERADRQADVLERLRLAAATRVLAPTGAPA